MNGYVENLAKLLTRRFVDAIDINIHYLEVCETVPTVAPELYQSLVVEILRVSLNVPFFMSRQSEPSK